jgi:hypothetical protein
MVICIDCRSSDKKKGRENDLDVDFVHAAISEGCSYCGDTDSRMTLDRIDNDFGHTKNNVVSACLRCNLTRGSMPFAAWAIIAPKMREARLAGLFGDWTPKRKPTRLPV